MQYIYHSLVEPVLLDNTITENNNHVFKVRASSASNLILPLTEDCWLIINPQLDEKNVLEESFRTLLGRWSNGGGAKYKIIDVDEEDISLSDLLSSIIYMDSTLGSVNLIFYHTLVMHIYKYI